MGSTQTKRVIRKKTRSGEFEVNRKKIQFNAEQLQAKEYIRSVPITVLMGGAGVGKTTVSVVTALALLEEQTNPFNKIVITRPMISAEDNLGILPGDIDDKFNPYLLPFYELFSEYGKQNGFTVEHLKANGQLKTIPIALIRGLTFADSIVLVDEAQNLTEKQIKLILTRISSTSKLIFTGDITQKDIKGISGMEKLIHLSKNPHLSDIIKIVSLSKNERYGIINTILENWE